MQPPTGPDSTSVIGSRQPRSAEITPPCEPISSSEPVKPPLRRSASNSRDVLADLRPDIGVGRRRRGALELVPFARQLGAGGDEDIGQQAAQLGGRRLLVVGREVGIEEADRDRLDLRVCSASASAASSSHGERRAHTSRSVDPLVTLEAQLARDQRRIAVEAQVERLRAVAAADLQHVAKALGGQQRGLGARRAAAAR